MKLKLLREVLSIADPAMREASRRSLHQRYLISESNKPQTGVYWVVPTSKGWSIYEFYEAMYGELMHESVWRKYMAPLLIDQAGTRAPGILNAYAGLPRGRVAIPIGKKHVIYHGNDSPDNRILDGVRGKFGLPANAKAVFDEHETMIIAHVYIIKNQLSKIKYDLPEPADPFADEWDWED